MFDTNNVETRYLFLNQSNATSGTTYDFQFAFNNAISQSYFQCGPDECVKLTPMFASITDDWDEIDSTNCNFSIILPSASGSYTYSFALPNGSPNILGLVAQLNALLSSTTLNYYNGSSIVALTVSVSFSTLYNVLQFNLSASPSSIGIDFRMANSANLVMGFSKSLYTFSGVNLFYSDWAPDISRLSEIYIYSSIVQENFTQYNNDGYSNLDNVQILFGFPITTNTGSNVVFENNNKLFEQIIRNNLDRLHIQIRDKNGNYVYTNSPSSFMFRFDKYRGVQAVETKNANSVMGLMYR